MSYVKRQIEKTLKHAAAKNIIQGVIASAIYLTITIIIPYLTFSWIMSLKIEDADVAITNKEYERIIYWIIAFGLIISGTAFFAYSAPTQSIRRGAFSVIQIILNCLYIWSYQFSGALDLDIELVDIGFITINLTQLILVYMGVYFLIVVLKVYDLVECIINRDKIRFERGRK